MSILLLSGLALAASPTDVGDLLLTEVQADTSVVAQYYGEWFEIYNNAGETINLNGVTFYHTSDGSTVQSLTVTSDLLVGVRDYVVFGVSAVSTYGETGFNGNVTIDYAYDFTNFNLSLSSETFQITYDGVVLDEVTWDPSWGIVSDAAHQASTNAFELEWANDFSTNWCSSEIFIPVSGMMGSPGSDNDYCGDQAGVDNDGDGYNEQEGDCRDDLASVNPDANDGSDGTDGNVDDWDDDCDGIRDDGDIDDDGDGYTEVAGDCDDTDANVRPGVTETVDGEDDDCDGCVDDIDSDGDGYTDECIIYCDLDGDGLDDDPCFDCDDTNNLINPEANETPYDGVDQNCDGLEECDLDEDGYESVPGDCAGGLCCSGTDCDDANNAIHPGAPEDVTDGIDNDCDGVVDIPDRDGDGFSPADGDCMDIGEEDTDDPSVWELSASVHPGSTELCDDLIDNDCDGFFDNLPECADPVRYATVRGGGLFCGVTGNAGEGAGSAAATLAGLLALVAVGRRSRRQGGETGC